MIRVLVVDDSAFMRKVITDIINEHDLLCVIETSKNGKDALKKIEELKPDVVTLDVEMPVLNGINTLKKIMAMKKNIAVIMISSLTSKGAELTLKALELGAFDFITKPKSIFKMDSFHKKKEIIDKIIASNNTNLSINFNKIKSANSIIINKKISTKKTNHFSNIIAIGTSTGGPRALQAIIPYLPKDINASILVVQHMPPGFTKSLSKRLNSMSNVNVKEAENNEILRKGYCYIAPGDYHMLVDQINEYNFHIKLNKNELVSGHRPSVDVMMESVSKTKQVNKIGIILTGMGSDGAEGIKLIKDNNGYTIAQNEESCVVYGMPKSAVKLGAVDKVVSIDKIAKQILKKMEV